METTGYTFSYINSLTQSQVADLFGVNGNQATGLKNRSKQAVLEGRGEQFLTRSAPRNANGNAGSKGNSVKLDSNLLAALTASCRKARVEFGVGTVRDAIENGNESFLAAMNFLLESEEELNAIKQWAGVKTPEQKARAEFSERMNLALVKMNAAHAAFDCYFEAGYSDCLSEAIEDLIEKIEHLAGMVTLPSQE